MPSCPYCMSPSAIPVTAGRPRPPAHTLVQCATCSGYFVLHANGKAFPLEDRTDMDGGVVNKVIDG